MGRPRGSTQHIISFLRTTQTYLDELSTRCNRYEKWTSAQRRLYTTHRKVLSSEIFTVEVHAIFPIHCHRSMCGQSHNFSPCSRRSYDRRAGETPALHASQDRPQSARAASNTVCSVGTVTSSSGGEWRRTWLTTMPRPLTRRTLFMEPKATYESARLTFGMWPRSR